MEGVKAMANEVTVLNVLSTFSHKSQLISLKELHGYLISRGFLHTEQVANAFIAVYAKCEALTSVDSVFCGIEAKNMNSWNALIDGYKQFGDPRQALDLYQQMTSIGLRPDWFTISNLLSICAELSLLHLAKKSMALCFEMGWIWIRL